MENMNITVLIVIIVPMMIVLALWISNYLELSILADKNNLNLN